MHFRPDSCYFLPLKSKYSPQHPSLWQRASTRARTHTHTHTHKQKKGKIIVCAPLFKNTTSSSSSMSFGFLRQVYSCLRFSSSKFFQGKVAGLTPNPQPGGPVPRIYIPFGPGRPRHWVAQVPRECHFLYPQMWAPEGKDTASVVYIVKSGEIYVGMSFHIDKSIRYHIKISDIDISLAYRYMA
jgi:hypothetical protein